MSSRMFGLLSAILLAVAPLSPALADDRDPTAEELGKIEAALRAEGFTAWEEIELDDGVWEVDDAVSGDGLKYDVVLDQSFAVIAREEDGRDLSRKAP
ncbi:PepSY domain-containing protein [Paracoccus aeridis]|uniref:PepSY domain-containing protein n=1 Tax=Paracoccus aeridis TaxID=1966466 RepID=UPI0010AB212D|nr:PepSY domain-containing protein [Paracoccus aeridis]